MENFSAATAPLESAATEDPENIHVHLALGWCYKRTGRIDLAICALENAAEHAPYEGIIYYNLACYWALCENVELAIEYLMQSFDLDPEYRDLVSGETDFDGIRDDPDFQMITSVIV
jgi:Flp pilus assembly protein TadD